MNTKYDFRLLELSEASAAAQVIAQAFVEDPLTTFMLPLRATRAKTLYKFFHPYSEINIKNKRGFGSGIPLQGVAFWKSPEQNNVSVSINALASFLPLLFTMYPIGYVRARSILQTIDELHNHHATAPHFYLDNIGVLPSARNKGISSKLIRPILEVADSQKSFVYTDTVTRSNVALYQHFGFQCMEERPVGSTGITVWSLLRSPR